MRAVIRLAPLVLLALAACRPADSERTRAAPEPQSPFTRLDERLRLQEERGPRPPDAPKPSHAPIPPVVDHLETSGGALKPVLRGDLPRVPHPAEVTLPATADGPFVVHDRDSGAEVRARLVGADAVSPKIEGDRVAYPGAFAGGDVVQRIRPDGTEDFLWLASAETRVAYEIEPIRGIAGLRLVEDALEFLDARGTPRLRIAPPWLVDAEGRTERATLSLEGCRYDTNPLGPWERPVTAPGARKCLVRVGWKAEGLAYPALLDPGWTTTGNMAAARQSFTMFKLASGRVFVYGGYGSGGSVSTAELYDPSTGTWGATGGWFPGHSSAASVLLPNGNVFVSGGYNENATNLTLQTTGIYSASTGTFSTFGLMITARRSHTATLLADGRVLLVAGYNSTTTAKSEIFDPPTSSSVPVPDVPLARWRHAAVRLPDGRVALLGGATTTDTIGRVDVFDPTTQTWSYSGSITPRADFVAQALPTGSVFVAGGATPGMEIYSLTLGGASTAYSPVIPANTALVDLGGGSVLVTGGTSSAAAYRVDQVSGSTVTVQPGMLYLRSLHGLARLDSGAVLATGGYSGSSTLSQSELLTIFNCTSSDQCASGRTCVDGYCCNSACSGSCDRCDVAGKEGTCTTIGAGTSGSPSCTPFLCDGTSASCPASCTADANCASGFYCAAGSCVAKKALGQACARAGECGGNQCVDGFCCNSSCSGGCDRCDVTGSEGTCTFVSGGGANPGCGAYVCSGSSGACPTGCTTDATCASGYVCSGGTCLLPKANGGTCTRAVECSSGFCADGYCCNSACSGACDECDLTPGTCRPSARGFNPGSCGNYRCDGTSTDCPTTCTANVDCSATTYCSGGSCVPKLGVGASCTSASECASTYCADGYCCGSACSGSCDRCDVSPGSCTLITGDATCAPYTCTGSSANCTSGCSVDAHCASTAFCNGSACTAKFPLGWSCSTNHQCQSGTCADGYCCNSACSGSCDRCDLSGHAGTCTPLGAGTSGLCGNYVCDGASGSCPTSCTSDASCLPGYGCKNGSCVPNTANGQPCTTAAPCISGYCSDGVCCSGACSGPCDACNLTGSVGTCTNFPANGQILSCQPYTCPGTSGSCATSCATDANCANGYYCSGGTCFGRKANALSCARDGECANGFCADGVCCNSACSGGCDRCNLPSTTGTCTAVGSYTASCGGYYCTGSASCPTSCTGDSACVSGYFCNLLTNTCDAKKASGGTCARAGECTNGLCVDGYCCDSTCGNACDRCDLAGKQGTCSAVPTGTAGTCGNYACFGSTQCPTSCSTDATCVATAYCLNSSCTPKKANGSTCTSANACQSGNCVDGFCCNSACGGACDRCDLAGQQGTCGLVGSSVACGSYLCGTGSAACPTSCTQDGDCAPGNYCNGTSCVAKVTSGGTCGRSGMCASGFCVDGFCCNTACGGACDRCDLQPGTCLASEAGRSGSCGLYVCNGTATSCPAGCSADTDCVPSAWCSNGRCVAKSPPGGTCSAANSCTSGFCADGVCCNEACGGACDRCDLGGKQGTCTALAAGTPSSCAPFVCDGTGRSCPTACTSDATCAPGYACRGGSCVANTPDGFGCASASQCTSGTCWNGTCCASACNGPCESCQQPGHAGQCLPLPTGAPSNQGSCAPYLCSGSAGTCPSSCAANADCGSGAFCDGSHHCVGTYAVGHACANDGECSNLRCVDGFCCDSACGQACDRCDVRGVEGRCVPVAAQTVSADPTCRFLCDGSNASCPAICRTGLDCAPGNWCRAGQCVAIAGPGASCTADAGCTTGHCADGVCCDGACTGGCDRCDLAGTVGSCRPLPAGSGGTNPSCGAYLCDGARSSCPLSCAADGDCADGFWCSGNRCVSKLAPGAACLSSHQCLGGLCTDGVCCERACDGQCEACNVSGHLGRCTPVVGAPVGGRAACAGASTDACRGACDGRTGASCTYPPSGFTCAVAACSAGEASARATCDGAGRCDPGEVTTCGAYRCDAPGVACRTSCSVDGDCADGFHCRANACVNDLPLASACRLGSECASGFCTDGVCCDRACGGGCDRCDLPDTLGRCTALSGHVPACAPYACDGKDGACADGCASDSACDDGFRCLQGKCVAAARTGERCSDARACASGFCADGVCCESACEGACVSCALPGEEGTCVLVTGAAAPGRPACGGSGVCGGTCDGTRADCTYPKSEVSCAPAYCSEGLAVSGGTCDGTGACTGIAATRCPGGCEAGRCLDTASTGGCAGAGAPPFALLALASLLARRRRR